VTEENFLMIAAQVAATLVGFAAVITVFQPSQSKRPVGVQDGLKLMIELGLGGVLLSLTPFLLFFYSNSSASFTWSVSSFLYCIYLLTIILAQFREVTRIKPRFFGLFISTFILPCILLVALNIANAFFMKESLLFLLGILWLIFGSGFQFYLLVRVLTNEGYETSKSSSRRNK
jgi:hypothetical protein